MSPNKGNKEDCIRFSDFNFGPSSFSCTVKASDRNRSDVLDFSWEGFSIDVDADSIALALSTLCGTRYAKVNLDLAVSDACRSAVAQFTTAEVSAKKADRTAPPPESRAGEPVYLLNFSGGFDSLAAKALLPPDAKLIAIDFGGWFQREADFFKRFDPIVLKTNFRALKYDRASWTFMGAAAILFAKGLNATHTVFGTNLESSPGQILKNPLVANRLETRPFSGVGLRDVRITNGLTEMGTAMMALRFFPEFTGESLRSLADPGSIKAYRKQQLVRLAARKLGISVDLPPCTDPNEAKAPSFEQSFLESYLALYEAKRLGREVAEKLVRNIPEELFALADSLSLDFFERFNTNYLRTIPPEWQPTYLMRLAQAGIVPYDENDWDEFAQVRDFFARYFPAVAGTSAKRSPPARSRGFLGLFRK